MENIIIKGRVKLKTNTDTFTMAKRENSELVRYCSYCGEKAQKEDIGSRHNRRWEEEIIYYCTCENSKMENEIKKKIASLNRELYKENRNLEEMKKKTNNNTVNKMKFDHELELIREKYQIT